MAFQHPRSLSLSHWQRTSNPKASLLQPPLSWVVMPEVCILYRKYSKVLSVNVLVLVSTGHALCDKSASSIPSQQLGHILSTLSDARRDAHTPEAFKGTVSCTEAMRVSSVQRDGDERNPSMQLSSLTTAPKIISLDMASHIILFHTLTPFLSFPSSPRRQSRGSRHLLPPLAIHPSNPIQSKPIYLTLKIPPRR